MSTIEDVEIPPKRPRRSSTLNPINYSDDSKCSTCGTTFKSLVELIKHSNKEHLNIKNKNCSTVSSGDEENYSETETQLVNHSCKANISKKRSKKTSKDFPKNSCGKSLLTTHIRDVHCGVIHQCDVCQKILSSSKSLHLHKKAHSEKLFVCQICNKAFHKFECLTLHEHIHTGEKPYECKICMKRFTQPSNLTRHQVVHSIEKLYKCIWCNKCFNLNANLKRHHNSCPMKN